MWHSPLIVKEKIVTLCRGFFPLPSCHFMLLFSCLPLQEESWGSDQRAGPEEDTDDLGD